VVTRRGALLAVGGAALLTGCGAKKDDGDTDVQLLTRQLEAQQAVVGAYAGLRGREVARLSTRARARVASLERALRAAGATPPGAGMAAGDSLRAALAAETEALQAHVAATGRTRDRAVRRLLGELIASTAASQALLERRLGQDPLASAFPGQAT
jgi:hypothetical protein